MSKEQLSTSDKEVPKHKNALEEKYKEQKLSREESKELTKLMYQTLKMNYHNHLVGDF
jgi:hypothetical protein